MNAGRIARLLWHLLALVVLVVSGAYLLIYLYRWEWNRALVSGLFFVATEILVAASTILSRIGRLERRLDEGQGLGGANGLQASRVLEEGEGGAAPRFSWLEPGDGFDVFVPVLLGVGVILSAVAYLVERLAAATAPLSGGEGTARRMASLETPRGALVPPTNARDLPSDAVWAFRAGGRRVVHVGSALSGAVVLLVSGLLATAVVSVLWDVAVNRPDPTLVGQVSSLELAVSQKSFGARSVDDVTEALWIFCRGTLPANTRLVAIEALRGDRVRVTLAPAIGRNSERRFVGCLEDATLDLVQADVTRFENVPSAPGPPSAVLEERDDL